MDELEFLVQRVQLKRRPLQQEQWIQLHILSEYEELKGKAKLWRSARIKLHFCVSHSLLLNLMLILISSKILFKWTEI